MEITKNSVVTVAYQLRLDSFDAEIVEETDKKHPLIFLYGNGEMLESFEEKLHKLKVNDTFKFVLKCEDAYGDIIPENITDLPKDVFLVDGKLDEDVIFPGNTIPMSDEEGNEYDAIVIEIKKDKITVDFNHPLAGEDLYFTGKILEVRKATATEIKHKHVHGPEGHAH